MAITAFNRLSFDSKTITIIVVGPPSSCHRESSLSCHHQSIVNVYKICFINWNFIVSTVKDIGGRMFESNGKKSVYVGGEIFS